MKADLVRRRLVELAADPAGFLELPTGIDTPQLLVDRSRLQRNLESMAGFARKRGLDLAPHAKTHKIPEIARLQVDAGAATLTVAKLGEAEAFHAAGLDHFLVAYPMVGAEKVLRGMRLARTAGVVFGIDSRAGAEVLGERARRENQVADVAMLIDAGLHREGLRPDAARNLASELGLIDGVRLRGILTHEGHAYRTGDAEEARRLASDVGREMVDLAGSIREMGFDIDTVSVGSTPTAKLTAETEGINQIRPGIYAFNDLSQVLRGTAELADCAARVVATVVSHAVPDRAIIDAGSKALSHDPLSAIFPTTLRGFGLVIGLPGWSLHGLSEEHGWLQWEGRKAPTSLAVGQQVQILPNHICPVFHALGECLVVEGGEYAATWRGIPRGSGR